jgi:glyoxylate/hydroxypyruvate reductase A
MAKSAILVAIDGTQAEEWIPLLKSRAKGRDLRIWPDAIGDKSEIAYALVWRPPPGLLGSLPNLKAILNIGAGVDALLTDPALPPLPLARAAHPDLTKRVVGYVVLHVLAHHNRARLYDAQQRERVWQPHKNPSSDQVAVGIMGLGVIGGEAAQVLARLGFRVAGWSRTPKSVAGIESFHGDAGLDAFLARTEILVSLLPLTPQTSGLLNLALFRKLKRDGAAGGAFLINAARGRIQVDADIVAALDEGALSAATLDVFPQEPLPAQSPLWSHPKVTLTPHVAGDISPTAFCDQLFEQVDRFERGEPLENEVDRARGY